MRERERAEGKLGKTNTLIQPGARDFRLNRIVGYRVSVSVLISIPGIDTQRQPLADIGIRLRYRKPIPSSSYRYRHLDVGIGYCRYRVPFRTLTVPDTVIVIDTGIRYRYLNGRMCVHVCTCVS